MQITLEDAAVGRGLGSALPPISLDVRAGAPTAIRVETDERPLLVSMLLGGRMSADSGRVLVDGRADANELRRRTALVDTPFVAEPSPGISLAGVVAEEFSFSGLPTSRRAVRDFLVRHDLADYASLPVRSVPPTDRVRLFSELALLRPGIGALIITSPERHGGEPAAWFATLAAIADRGTTIAVVTDAATSDILIRLGARDAFAVHES
jgi:hypothetical protein